MSSLFDASTLLTFCLAAAALVVAPGPGQAIVVARTIEGGSRAGYLTALGLQCGTLVHTIAAALGLSALLAASATAFAVVKYAGAIYLVILGVIALRSAKKFKTSAAAWETTTQSGANRLLLHATMTGILNPKVALFFLAFLPQFVRRERGAVLLQFLVLGLIFAILGFIGDATLATIVGRARARLVASSRFAAWRERATGIVLIGLGLRLALPDRR